LVCVEKSIGHFVNLFLFSRVKIILSNRREERTEEFDLCQSEKKDIKIRREEHKHDEGVREKGTRSDGDRLEDTNKQETETITEERERERGRESGGRK
jgi:hypothetical protein